MEVSDIFILLRGVIEYMRKVLNSDSSTGTRREIGQDIAVIRWWIRNGFPTDDEHMVEQGIVYKWILRSMNDKIFNLDIQIKKEKQPYN